MSKARHICISRARDDIVGNFTTGITLILGRKCSKCYKKQTYSTFEELLADNPDYSDKIKYLVGLNLNDRG